MKFLRWIMDSLWMFRNRHNRFVCELLVKARALEEIKARAEQLELQIISLRRENENLKEERDIYKAQCNGMLTMLAESGKK